MIVSSISYIKLVMMGELDCEIFLNLNLLLVVSSPFVLSNFSENDFYYHLFNIYIYIYIYDVSNGK